MPPRGCAVWGKVLSLSGPQAHPSHGGATIPPWGAMRREAPARRAHSLRGLQVSLAPTRKRARPWVVGRGPRAPALAATVRPPHGGRQRAPLSTRVRPALPCPQPSRAPTSLGVKKKKKPSPPPRPPGPCTTCSCPLPGLAPSLAHPAPATHAFLLFLPGARPVPAPGPLHGLFALAPSPPAPPPPPDIHMPPPSLPSGLSSFKLYPQA